VLWHTIRNADGSWQGEFGAVQSQSAGGASTYTAVTGGSADEKALQVVGVGSDGVLWHTIRNDDGSWQAEFGAVQSQSAGGAPTYTAVGAAGA